MSSLGKSSFGLLAQLFGVSRPTTYDWIRQMAGTIDEPVLTQTLTAIDFDEMWHLLPSKKEKAGSAQPWIMAQGELLPGYAVVVMLPHATACMTKENIFKTVYVLRIPGMPLDRDFHQLVMA